ncbi:MAG: T9SS type A sorting domain-containing protein [Ignavibacteriales bacterium]|nr:T9SS type A sorting domain-containing protein [Ignavibacteriales bacterium]
MWTVRVFSHKNSDPSGSLSKIWEQHFIGVKAGTIYDNGLVSGKLKPGDANDVIFLSLNPYMFVFKWSPLKQSFEPQWIHSSQSNSAIIYDFDNDGINDVGFRSNGKTEFWSLENSATTVQAPWALSARSLSVTKVRLQWNSSTANHKIYRGTSPDSLFNIANVLGTEWIDTSVVENRRYYYRVTAIASSESQRSNSVQIIPHAAPVISGVVLVSRFQLIAELSFDLSSENLYNSEIMVDDTISSSSIVWKTPRKLLVTFPQPMQNGNRLLRTKKLVDASGMEGDTTQIFPFIVQIQDENEFFVRSVLLASKNTILVEFNDNLNFAQALVPSHYTVKNIAKEYFVSRVDSISPNSIRLNFPGNVNLAEIALRIEIKLSENIRSNSGVQLMAGKGQVLSIAQETESIGNIVVYPNPVRKNQRIAFVNIPSNCRITIFSPNGENIKIFDDVTTSEGISWDLVDERGDQLSSGIYLYRVEKIDQSGSVTNSILGKFAVIR